MNVHSPMSPEEATELEFELYQKLSADFPFYANECLRIKQRDGGEYSPFKLNKAQRWANEQLNNELRERGYVRALLPKARQLGCSTLIAGRFYHKTSMTLGTQTYIVTHSSEATGNLFDMVKYYDRGAHEAFLHGEIPFSVTPTKERSNRNELLFADMRSGYRVGTAEGNEVGRSLNNQLLHLSEVAMFKKEAEIATSLIKTVHLQRGTEVVLESTGKGPFGMFYNMCMQAMNEENQGLWRAYFMPWFWDEDYVAEAPRHKSFRMPDDFMEYQELHKLTDNQLYWFYNENITAANSVGGDVDKISWLCRQENPATMRDSFMSPSEYMFFRGEHTERATQSILPPTANAPRILGVDPTTGGADRFWLMDRQGRTAGSRINEEVPPMMAKSASTAADYIFAKVIQHRIQVVVVDATGIGKPIYDMLKLKLPRSVTVIPITFSHSAINKKEHVNKKAEIYDYLRKWLAQTGEDQVNIPNDTGLVGELGLYKWGIGECERNDKSQMKITSKTKIEELLKGMTFKSPDKLEALALTTAYMDERLMRIVQNAHR